MRNEQQVQYARAELRARIDRLDRSGRNIGQLEERVHGIRGLAAAYGFTAVAGLADRLEREIVTAGRTTIVSAYVDRMLDALACGQESAKAMEAMLASVQARYLA
jgi:HPt (histidine-containing phosphotransfer) domain-containing protein